MIKSQRNLSVSLISAYLVFVAALLLLLLLDEDNMAEGMKGLFSGKSKSKKKKEEESSTHHHEEEDKKDEEQPSQPSYDYGYGYGASYGESDHGASYGVIHHESPKASPPRAVIDHAYQEPTELASAMGNELFWSPVKADAEFWSNPDEHMPTYKAAQEMKEREEAKAKGGNKKWWSGSGSRSGKNKKKDEDEE